MGYYIGVYAQTDNEVITSTVFSATEASGEGLGSYLVKPQDYFNSVLSNSNLASARKDWLRLTEEEEKSLMLNHVYELADEQIEHYEALEENVPNHFFAIGMGYDKEKDSIEYSEKYLKYENWSNSQILISSLEKLSVVTYEKFKEVRNSSDLHEKIANQGYREAIELLQITKILKSLYQVNKFALVLGSY